MIISFVVAAAENDVIGRNNQLPWHLPNDLKFFKNTTWGMPVIMGRKTFESFGKPLAGRVNIVVTGQKDWKAAGAIVVNSIDAGIQAAATADTKEAFIIGGGEIFRQSFSMANRIYLTRVHASPEGDAFFPEIPANEWKLMSARDFTPDAKHAFGYSFQVWERLTADS